MVLLSTMLLPMLVTIAVFADKKPTSRQDEQNKECKSLMEGSDNNEMNVLCVGLLSKYLLLITKSLFVFELPKDALKGGETTSRLYMGQKPVPLAKKWPKLANDTNFKALMKATNGNIYNSFTVMDPASEYILFIAKTSETGGLQGVTYDLVHDKMVKGFKFNMKYRQVMISASEKMLFYAMRKNEDDRSLIMSEFTFYKDKNATNKAKTLNEAKIMNPAKGKAGDWKSLCQSGGEKMYLGKNKTKCESVEFKKPLRGFIDGDQVYIFGSMYIYVFDLKAVAHPGTLGHIGKKRYDGFFVCHPDYLKWALIALALLMLLLLLLLLLWLCCCRGKKKKPDTKKGTKKASRKSRKSAKGSNKGRNLMMLKSYKKSSKKSKLTSKYNSQVHDATGRSAFAHLTRKPKSKRSSKPHSMLTSKYNSQAHDATGRSAFAHQTKKPRSKRSKKLKPHSMLTSKYNSQAHDATGRSAFAPKH